MALTIFTAVNNEGRNVIVAFALVQRETMDTYEWLLKNLVNFNNGEAPKIILTDFDPSMSGAIEKTLPETTHLLCQWHMQQNFKKHFLYLNMIKGPKSLEARYLYKYLTGEAIFNSEHLLGPERIKYLRQMWQIKEKWTAAFAPKLFIAGTHTTSRGEAVNA